MEEGIHRLKSRHYSQKLWLSVKRGVFEGIHTEQIEYIEADDHYLKINMTVGDAAVSGQYVIKSSLKDFYEKQLVQHRTFYPLSRSHIVNLNKVWKIENNQLFLESNTCLSIPKSRRKEVLSIIGLDGNVNDNNQR